MGVAFTLLCDHALTWSELYDLPTRLNDAWSCPPALSEFVAEHVRAGASNWLWARDRAYSSVAEELFEAGQLSIDGPDGFRGTALKRGIEVIHLARWTSFLHDPDVQDGLQSAARRIGQIVRATHLLYLPDSAFPPSVASDVLFEGKSIEDALAWLRAEVGAPFASPGDVVGNDDADWDERGWFYERVAG